MARTGITPLPIFDSAGNLYGTTGLGGTDSEGIVFELTDVSYGLPAPIPKFLDLLVYECRSRSRDIFMFSSNSRNLT
jgi:hypothetical protein